MIKAIVKNTVNALKLLAHQDKWRNKNKHNLTTAGNVFPIGKVSVGNATYGAINVYHPQDPACKLVIGNYCSIGNDVVFILSGEHNYRCLSTYPFKVHMCGQRAEAISKGPIIVRDDVWIGMKSIIMSGVTLGQGCVIGAGSVVAKSVPPYAIFAGGKVIKYRFPQEVINQLLKINFAKLDVDTIRDKTGLLYSEDLNDMIDSDLYKWLIS